MQQLVLSIHICFLFIKFGVFLIFCFKIDLGNVCILVYSVFESSSKTIFSIWFPAQAAAFPKTLVVVHLPLTVTSVHLFVSCRFREGLQTLGVFKQVTALSLWCFSLPQHCFLECASVNASVGFPDLTWCDLMWSRCSSSPPFTLLSSVKQKLH